MHSTIQAKLNIGEPGDKFEQEADDTAARVMQKPASVQRQTEQPEDIQQMSGEEAAVTTKSFVQTGLFDEEKDVPGDMLNAKELSSAEASESKDDETIQTKASDHTAGAAFENRLNSAKGGGEKLPADTQAEMENRFGGKDFSNVRVHTDSASAQMNKEIKSKAFTNENHIFFNSGQYSNGQAGKELLAHELTHTVQQGATEDKVQRKPEDYAKSEDSATAEANTEETFSDELGEDVSINSVPTVEDEETEKPDEDEKETDRKEEIASETRPDADRHEEAKPAVDSNTKAVAAAVEKEPEGPGKEPELPIEEKKKKLTPKEQAELDAQNTFMEAMKVKPPKMPKPVKPLDLEVSEDAKGNEKPTNMGLLIKSQMLAQMIESLRQNGFALQLKARQEKVKALELKANIYLLMRQVFENDETLKVQDAALITRKDLNEKSKEQQVITEKKTEKVTAEIGPIAENSKALHTDSEPLVSDIEGKESEQKSAATKGDDPDTQESANESAGELENAGGESKAIDEKFASLDKDSGLMQEQTQPAAEHNIQSALSIAETDAMLAQTTEKLGIITAHNEKNKIQADELMQRPDKMIKNAEDVDKQGAKQVKESLRMEKKLEAMNNRYLNKIDGLPAREDESTQSNVQTESFIQRQPDDENGFLPDEISAEEADQLLGIEQGELEGDLLKSSDNLEVEGRLLKGIGETVDAAIEDIASVDVYELGTRLSDQVDLAKNDPGQFFMGMLEGINSFFAPPKLLPGEPYARYYFKWLTNAVTGLATLFGLIAGLCFLAIAAIGILAFWFFPGALPLWPEIPILTVSMETFGSWSLMMAVWALKMRLVIGIFDLIGMTFAGTAEEQDNWTRMMKENVAGVWAPLMIFVPTKFAFKRPKLRGNRKTGPEGNKKKTDVRKESTGGQNQHKTELTEKLSQTNSANVEESVSVNQQNIIRKTNTNSGLPIGKQIRIKYNSFLERHPDWKPELDRLETKLKNLEDTNAPDKLKNDAAAELEAYEGKMFEKAMQERFSKKIVRQNEVIMDPENPGQILTEIDFETTEALVQVKRNPQGYMAQYRKTLTIAMERGKKLIVLYDPMNITPKQVQSLINEISSSNVIFLPLTP